MTVDHQVACTQDYPALRLETALKWAALAMIFCLFAGCAVGPDFHRPAAPSTDRYTAQPLPASTPASERSDDIVQSFAVGADIPNDWWTAFQSDALNTLIREALEANPNLQAADASLREARENMLAQRSTFFPSVDLQYTPIRQLVAPNLASPLASGTNIYTLHTAQLNIGYVPDVFGGNRRQVESLQAEMENQRFQLEAARITLATNVVITVVQQASLRAQIKTTRLMVELATRQLDLLHRQRSFGQIGLADVAAQETALAQVKATLPPLEQQLTQQGNQLAVLLNRLPSEVPTNEIELDTLKLPTTLPVSLPSSLVQQRPDVRAAEEQLHAASAQIGVAIANRLPNFSLTANAGSAAAMLSKLFTSGTGFWSISANVVQPIFDGGALMHRQRAVQAAYDQAAAQYRNTVLLAFQNVADTLSAIQSDAQTAAALQDAERAAENSLRITRQQSQAGAVNMLVVLNAELAYRQTALSRIQAQASRLSDSVALFQALGGGWWNLPATQQANAVEQ